MGGVSHTGLAAIIRELQRSALPCDSKIDKHVLQAVTLAEFDALRHVVPMPSDGGGEGFNWDMLDPNRLFATMAAEPGTFRDCVAAAIANHPPSRDQPWSLIVAFDEFAPGNKLNASAN